MKIKKNKLDSSLKLIARTSSIVFVGLIISKILSYIYRIIIARYFGPETYGLFTLALTIVSFFITFAAFGFSDGILRYVPLLRAKNKFNEIRYLIRNIFYFYLMAGFFSSVLLFLLSDFIAINLFHNPALSIFIKIMDILIITNLLTSLYLACIRGFENISLYSFIYNIFQNLARVGILLVLILISFNSDGSIVAWSFVFASLLTLILSRILIKRKINNLFDKYKKQDYSGLRKEFFNYSWPIMFYSALSLVFYWIDSFSIGYFKSAIEVGFYNAAVPIALLLGIAPEIFMQLFFPLINRKYANGKKKLVKDLSKQVTKWIFMINLPIFILIFFFPGAALNILFGEQYLLAETSLRILLIGSFISSIAITSVNLISMLGKSKLILVNILIASVTNFVLNAIFVPMPIILGIDNSLGITGAAISTLISIVLFNFLFIMQTLKNLHFIPIRRKMINIALVSIIPTTILFYFRGIIPLNLISIILISMLFFIIYFLLTLVSGSFDENDLNIIRAIWRKMRSTL